MKVKFRLNLLVMINTRINILFCYEYKHINKFHKENPKIKTSQWFLGKMCWILRHI